MTLLETLSLATTYGQCRYDAIRTAQDDYNNAYSEEGEDIDSMRAMLCESYLASIDGTLSPGETLTDDERAGVAIAYANAYCDLIIGARRESACICGDDHDCRATGCDLDCPACC